MLESIYDWTTLKTRIVKPNIQQLAARTGDGDGTDYQWRMQATAPAKVNKHHGSLP
jgi:hypothetical protein